MTTTTSAPTTGPARRSTDGPSPRGIDGSHRRTAGRTTARPPLRVRRVTPAAQPRLLLPPVPEPPSEPAVLAAALASTPAVRSVRSAVTEDAWDHAPRLEPVRAPLPPAEPVCAQVVLAAVEAIAGARSVAQLVRWLTPELHERLAARVVETERPTVVRRATVLRCRVFRVSADVAEGTVVVHDGRRVRAAAVRLEEHRGRWRATVLQIG